MKKKKTVARPAKTVAKKKAAPGDEVNAYMKALSHPLKREIEELRRIVKSCDKSLTEHIKWNGPSYVYKGEDRVTFRLHPRGILQIIFHRGAKSGASSKGFRFEDPSGLLQWLAEDRGVVSFEDMKDVKSKATALKKLVQHWIKAAA